MFGTVFMIVAFFAAGTVIGAVAHEAITEKAAATESEIFEWKARLVGALAADEKTAKAKITGLVSELEQKLVRLKAKV